MQTESRKCIVQDCAREIVGRGLCKRHWQQFNKHGKIVRTVRGDGNRMEIDGEVAYIFIQNRAGKDIGRVIVDKADLPLVSEHKWSFERSGRSKVGYAANRNVGRMHRLIMDAKEGQILDHINHNSLDNRRCNLRFASLEVNRRNSLLNKRNVSGVNGVYRKKDCNRWIARLSFNGKTYYKSFLTKEEAITKRKELEEKYWGDER